MAQRVPGTTNYIFQHETSFNLLLTIQYILKGKI